MSRERELIKMIDKGTYKMVKGDVTNPIGEGTKIIPHVISDLGVCGAGVAKVIVEKWSQVKKDLQIANKELHRVYGTWLGNVVNSEISDDLVICSMIAQTGLRSKNKPQPIKYYYLTKAMHKVLVKRNDMKHDRENISIHCPKFGAGLAGGNWDFIEILIKEIWVDAGINVFVYEL